MTAGAVPLADAPALRPAALRTRAVRTALAAALVGLVAAAAVSSRHPRLSEVAFLPDRATAIVVLDLSASISTDTFQRIEATLAQLSHSNRRFGLVIFSGTAYEALPPGTPGRELASYERFFRLTQPAPGYAPAFPQNPWTERFSAGTSISSGLDLARAIILRRHLGHPTVVLVSDLDDDPGDVPRVVAAALSYQRLGIPIHVVGLNPSGENQRLFERLAGPRGSFSQAVLPGQEPGAHARAGFPVALAIVAGFVAMLLAANELWGARLRWGAAA
jgi:hypothetical protein